MAKIKGEWRWNPKVREVSVGEEFRCAVNITTEQGTYHYIQIASAGTNQVFPSLSGGSVVGPLIGYGLRYFNGILSITSGSDGQGNMSVKDEYRFMDFGETEQEVSDEFYNYLVANATPSTIAEKLTLIAENEQKVFDAGYEKGKQAEYDAFWDDFQMRGTRSTYFYTFSQFTDDIFHPKYDIKPTANAGGMFASASIVDLTQRLIDCGVKLDTQKAKNLTEAFAYSTTITRIPIIDTSSSRNITYLCASCSSLVELEKLILKSDGSQAISDAFNYCSSLKNIVFEGVIGQDINFQWSTKLTKASIESIITHLSDTASGKTLTLSKTAVHNAFPDTSNNEEWGALVMAHQNWTITLV
jgi:hypothetical protein